MPKALLRSRLYVLTLWLDLNYGFSLCFLVKSISIIPERSSQEHQIDCRCPVDNADYQDDGKNGIAMQVGFVVEKEPAQQLA